MLNVSASFAEATELVGLADFDKLNRNALSKTEKNNCSTPDEVLQVAGWKRLHRLNMLATRITPRHLPENGKGGIAGRGGDHDFLHESQTHSTSHKR